MKKHKQFLYWIQIEYNDFDHLLRCVSTLESALNAFIYNYFLETLECPYCKCSEIYNYKKFDFFKCKKCRRQFRSKTGTLFEGSPLTHRQIMIGAYLIMKEHISTYEVAKEMGCSQKTAWIFKQKIKDAWNIT